LLHDNVILITSRGDYFYEDSAFHWNVMIHATQCCKVDRRLFHYRRSRVGQTSYGLRTNASEQSKNTTQSDESYSIEMVNALTNAAKMGGVLPNAHHVSRILSDFFTQKHDQSQQSRVSSSFDKQKKKIVSIYFRLLTKSFIPSFGQKQVTSKMKAKFARRLEDINQQIWSPQEQEYISIPSDYTMALKNLKKRHLKNEHPIDLSIVVTTLNAASSIQLLLDQVYAELSQLAVQSNFHFEIFSIDRGSNDDTFSVLRKYAQGQKSNFYLMSSSSDAGEGRAFNKAIPFLEGKYVYFLNTDYSYNFTALAESVSYAAANDHDVLILPPVSSMSSKDNEGTKKMQTTTTLPNDDLIWRAVKGLENRVDPQIQKHAALGLSSSSLWRQITASKLIFDEDIAFGPTRDNYLVQFHWLSIGASKNLRFYDKAVWSSSSHNNTTTMNADDNSSVGGYDDIVSEVFASIGIAQRAMAKSGIFQAKDGDIIFQQWKCFVSSFLHTTQTTIPQASVAKFQVLYNHFNTHILSHGIPPKDLQSFPYWGATRFAEPILVQSQLRDHVYAS
jgi:Glycosyltransferases involved in cell wall biogenesis